jgi:hypothetical protein
MYTELFSRAERSGITWLQAGVWLLKGRRRNSNEGMCPSYLGEEDVTHILLDCLETGDWIISFK